MEKLLVSACLLGINCKYNGKNNKIDLEELKKYYELIPVCPEVDGGLSTPRDPSEIQGSKVISNKGKDVTKEYMNGAKNALSICKTFGITKALLKEKSPSCGSHYIYDGTFTGTKIPGKGATVTLLECNGIKVYSEDELNKLMDLAK